MWFTVDIIFKTRPGQTQMCADKHTGDKEIPHTSLMPGHKNTHTHCSGRVRDGAGRFEVELTLGSGLQHKRMGIEQNKQKTKKTAAPLSRKAAGKMTPGWKAVKGIRTSCRILTQRGLSLAQARVTSLALVLQPSQQTDCIYI